MAAERRARGVIFDLFGTLVPIPTGRGYRRMLGRLIRTLRVPAADFLREWERDRQARMTGALPVEANLRKIVGRDLRQSRPASAYARAMAVYHRTHVRWMAPKPDAVRTLQALRGRGYRVALLSNCSSSVSAIWPRTPLAPLFDVAVLSCDVGLAKPDTRIFSLATSRLGVRPSACVYVGDGGDGELGAAARAGMRPIRVAHHTGDGLMFSADGLSLPALRSLSALLRHPWLP